MMATLVNFGKSCSWFASMFFLTGESSLLSLKAMSLYILSGALALTKQESHAKTAPISKSPD